MRINENACIASVFVRNRFRRRNQKGWYIFYFSCSAESLQQFPDHDSVRRTQLDRRKTLNTYHFDELADKHSLFLLSPSFRDRSYWEPEAWSGEALLKAIAELEKLYQLTPQKIYLYGYSAGGQCATLFANWLPERVSAWGAHACGVYPETIHTKAPALLTCGREDSVRFQLSQLFLYRYRENGGALLWKPLASGHDLSKMHLILPMPGLTPFCPAYPQCNMARMTLFRSGNELMKSFAIRFTAIQSGNCGKNDGIYLQRHGALGLRL